MDTHIKWLKHSRNISCERCSRVIISIGSGRDCIFSPIKEAVCSCENPAGRDERTTAEEPFLKDSSDPWLWLDGYERTSHDLIRPPLRTLATRSLWRDESVWIPDAWTHLMPLRYQRSLETNLYLQLWEVLLLLVLQLP